ncbi:hypothetical protein [Streptococcus acidominimus]|uniref:Uncharacterized protein n=1 Tax=Streptococcus acidominimus TaxID=1326 RepID=A0A380IAX6_STRAI|nr:hypothetical protein [Streptococcus acidominimus]QBX13646.1 hypothetical protein Javan1_0006 [Streptococcus phage Javan1]SUN05232.1 Uncharacterised protein [Streptococcus acidominimus]
MGAKIKYTIFSKNADEAIDIKNKIIINTTNVEELEIDISINEAYVFY